MAVLNTSSVLSIKTMPFAQQILVSKIFQQLHAVGIGVTSISELIAIASDPLPFLMSKIFNFDVITDLQRHLLLLFF